MTAQIVRHYHHEPYTPDEFLARVASDGDANTAFRINVPGQLWERIAESAIR